MAPPGLATALAEELRTLVPAPVSDRPFGASGVFNVAETYQILADSLIAGHVYLPLMHGPAGNANLLYQTVCQVDWAAHIPEDASISVSATGQNEQLNHTGFVARRVKDGIVDSMRQQTGSRPDVDTTHPDVRIHVHIYEQECALSIELSNGSLHRRGYRTEGGLAPLRENLAAGLLWRARWPSRAQENQALIDPFCGSGTFLVEAALARGGMPAAMREARLGSPAWLGHRCDIWQGIISAPPRTWLGETPAAEHLAPLIGQDNDFWQISAARANAERAGVADQIQLVHQNTAEHPLPALPETPVGLLISNIPFGHRVYSDESINWAKVTEHWCQQLDQAYWAILRPEEEQDPWPLFFDKPLALNHGGQAVVLLRGQFSEKSIRRQPGPRQLASKLMQQARNQELAAPDFANRLQKNRRKYKSLIRRGETTLRLFDTDLPDYNVAIDWYLDETGLEWLNIQEYRPPAEIDPKKARERLAAATLAASEVLSIPEGQVLVRTRARQKGQTQYQRVSREGVERIVRESQARLWVNFTDYLDTGLFIDHRLVRDHVAELAVGKRLLNLFCYTASASVRAAVAGAEATLSVDLSNTYLKWAERNFNANQLTVGKAHRLLRADVTEWLARPPAGQADVFDVVFCDPPSFSNSKAMHSILDISKDHPHLIANAMERVTPSGVLVFSTNRRGFNLAETVTQRFAVKDISHQTLPPDFSRHPNRRSVFEIRHKDAHNF